MQDGLAFDAGGGVQIRVAGWQDLETWLATERSRWTWLDSGDPSYDFLMSFSGTFTQSWNRLFEQLHGARMQGSKVEQFAETLSEYIPAQIVTSFGPDGQKVLDIHRQHGTPAAAFALAYLKQMVGPQQAIAPELLTGLITVVLPETAELPRLRDDLLQERTRFKSSIQRLTRKLEDEQRERRAHTSKFLRRAAHVGLRTLRGKRSSWETQQTNLARLGLDAVNSIKATEAAFSEKMRLKAPVEYWRRKEAEHREGERRAVRRLQVFFPLASLLVLGGFYVGADVILRHKGAVGQPTPTALYFVITGALAFLTTVTFWVGRIFTKLYLSEHHLRNDAGERAIMTETYLALTNDEAAQETDRQIVLSALFRSTADGIIKDDGPADLTLAALLSKLPLRS